MSTSEYPKPSTAPVSRRKFLHRAGAGTAAIVAANSAGLPIFSTTVRAAQEAVVEKAATPKANRKKESYKLRVQAAKVARSRTLVDHVDNGDEARYPNRIASFTKGLPHNARGEVDTAAYDTLLKAIGSESPDDFENIVLGLGRKFVSPQAGLAFDLQGSDSHHVTIPPAPRFDSAEEAGEMAELYWMALARDVHFNDYPVDPLIARAANDLSTNYSDFRGPRDPNAPALVTPQSIFRGTTPGDLVGPWISQFLWLDVPYGAVIFPQRMNTVVPGLESDYMADFDSYLAVQNGSEDLPPQVFDPTTRYIRNLRDLAQWVHVDALYQGYHFAGLILLGLNCPVSPGLPYTNSRTQEGFAEFGGPHILSLLTEVATRALKAVWYQKWFVHRRLRPEAFGGFVHLAKRGEADYPIHNEIRNSAVLDEVWDRWSSYLLAQVFPEGSPTHPAYGAGHATVAGACVTMLKAFFDESFVIPNPVVPNADGTGVEPYNGPALTVGGELNKVAANIAIGRNGAGVHYRTDYTASVRLGEAVAISILQEQKLCHNQEFLWRLTTFDGHEIVI